MQPRRSRMRRTKTGKCLALTDRDLEIFRTLQRYRFLRSTYLHAFVGGASEKRFVERLGDLFHEGYLDRPAEQWRFADARYRPVVHELGKAGAAALEAGAVSAPEPVTWLRVGPHRQFEHSLMICEVLASIELATRGRDDIRFIPWPEILAKAPDATRQSAIPYVLSVATGVAIVPDAIFGLEYRSEGHKAFRFFALEADRGTMPVTRTGKAGTSLIAKLEAYGAFLAQEGYRRVLGVPNLLVLTTTVSGARCDTILERSTTLLMDRRAFLFRGFDGVTAPYPVLLSEPWQRANAPPLCLDQMA